MKTATVPEIAPATPDFWEGFEVISIYTREQAIEDGTLVDLSAAFPHIVRRFFKLPLACTAVVWNVTEFAAKDNPASDVAGVVGFVCLLAQTAAKTMRDGNEVLFNVPLKDAKGQPYARKMKLHIGPGDEGEAVLTLMMHDED